MRQKLQQYTTIALVITMIISIILSVVLRNNYINYKEMVLRYEVGLVA